MKRFLIWIAAVACILSVAPAAQAQKRFALSPDVPSATAATSLAFTPDSQLLAVLHTVRPGAGPAGSRADESRISIWDVASRKQIRLLEAEQAGGSVLLPQIACSPDGKWLALVELSAAIRLWNTTTWEATQVSLPKAPEPEPKGRNPVAVPECLGLAFSPDSRRLAVLCDRHAKNHGGFVWIHEVDGAARPTMLDLEGRPAAVAWQSPRRLALVVTHIGKARDQHCELQEWELHATPSAGSPPALARRQRLGASVSLAQFSPAGNELALAANDSVAICNVRDGQIRRLGEVGDWNGHRTPNYRVGASALAFSPAGATLAAAGNANRTHTRIGFFALRSQIFDFDSDAFDHGPGYGVVKIAFAPDGERLATIVHRWAGSGETLFLWELGRKVE